MNTECDKYKYCVQSYNPHDPGDQSPATYNQFFSVLSDAEREAEACYHTMDGRSVSLFERKDDRWELIKRWP